MSGLTGLLEALVAKHDAIGSPIRHYLRPPLGTDDVTFQLRSLDLDPTADVLELYAWHDGIDQDAWQRDGGRGHLSVFSRADFPSLDRAARGCGQYGDVAEEIASHTWTRAKPEDLWRADWFPIFVGDPEIYAIACGTDDRDAIWRISWHPDVVPTGRAYGTLAELIETAIKRFDEGAYEWLPDDRILVSTGGPPV